MRLPTIPDVPYLDVVAAVNDRRGTLTLFIVNRHLTRDIATRISITGFSPAGDGSVETLYASSVYDKNDEAHPEAVVSRESRMHITGRTLDYLFRHESVTVLQLYKKS